ncbi:hypothetical protein CEXT_556631 [Caerostris extrusa]|uniref:Uncharacterized protein n=1 Tax=Caerostris extrusa TaxID=172846 RepID=A0AAV4SH11_CAEEX|nr:hypothetical protein CEXT_556631 [Caerostris extrusa]
MGHYGKDTSCAMPNRKRFIRYSVSYKCVDYSDSQRHLWDINCTNTIGALAPNKKTFFFKEKGLNPFYSYLDGLNFFAFLSRILKSGPEELLKREKLLTKYRQELSQNFSIGFQCPKSPSEQKKNLKKRQKGKILQVRKVDQSLEGVEDGFRGWWGREDSEETVPPPQKGFTLIIHLTVPVGKEFSRPMSFTLHIKVVIW